MNKEIAKLYDQKVNTKNENDKKRLDEEIAKESLKSQSQKIQSEIKKLKTIPHGRIKRVFKVKEMLSGSKKDIQEKVAVKDFFTKDLLVTEKEIKQASLKYCLHLLTNKEPEYWFKREVNSLNNVHEIRMKKPDSNDE